MAESEWTGPKEWRPRRWEPTPLLTDEENLRVAKLFRQKVPFPGEVRWLIDVLARVSSCAPNDYKFPAYAALVNPITLTAYVLSYKETLLMEERIARYGDFSGMQTFDRTTTDQPCDATLVARPYVRVVHGKPESIEVLRRSTLVMRIDGEEVLKTPIEEHLIGPSGEIYRKIRWCVRSTRTQCLFLAAALSPKQEADLNRLLGIFCANGSRIQLDVLHGIETFRGDMELAIGLVAARYTTKR